MRWIFLALSLFASTALAQEQGSRTDPQTGERYVPARPPDGPLRGAVRVPGWAVYLAGAVVSASAATVLVRRLRRRR